MAVTTEHWEMHGYPRSRYVMGHFTAVRRLMCAWSDRKALILEFDKVENLAYPYDEGPSSPPALIRSGKIDPFPARVHQKAGKVSMASYDLAVITLYYSTDGPRLITGELVDERIESSTTYTSVNPRALYWAGDVRLNPGEIQRVVPGQTLTRRLHQTLIVPSLLWLDSRQGEINANILHTSILGRSFAPYTVLYRGYSLSRTLSLGQIPYWDLTVHYSIRDATWYRHWRAATGQYELVYEADGTTVYPNYLPTVWHAW